MSQFKIFTNAVASTKAGAQVQSHEGGTVFRATDATLFERFLILGTFGTFYANSTKITKDATRQALAYINANPADALDAVANVVENRLAYRRDPSLFALAALTLPGIPLPEKRMAAELIGRHVITGTDILHWAEYRKMLGGKWNRTSRDIVNNYFLRDRNDLALQAIKYQQRDGWSLRDLLRLGHPITTDEAKREILDFIAHPDTRMEKDYTIPQLQGWKAIRIDDTPSEVVRKYRVPREAVPSELLANKDTWDALLDDMPGQALLRNLGKLGSLGLLDGEHEKKMIAKITSAANRVHPMQFLVAWHQYSQGHGERGSNTWTVNEEIQEALERAYRDSFNSLPVVDTVRPLIALDVSGSMTSPAMGLPMSCIGVELCMVEVLAYQFPHAIFAAYSQGNAGERVYRWMEPAPEHLPILNVKGKSRFDLADEVESYSNAFSGTDCAIPLRMAEKDRSISAVVSITDSETGYGESPAAVLKRIHAQGRDDFRHAVIGLAMNDISIADPLDTRQMDIVGASANLPEVLASFLSQAPHNPGEVIDGIDRDSV